jgi:hypothetical protein
MFGPSVDSSSKARVSRRHRRGRRAGRVTTNRRRSGSRIRRQDDRKGRGHKPPGRNIRDCRGCWRERHTNRFRSRGTPAAPAKLRTRTGHSIRDRRSNCADWRRPSGHRETIPTIRRTGSRRRARLAVWLRRKERLAKGRSITPELMVAWKTSPAFPRSARSNHSVGRLSGRVETHRADRFRAPSPGRSRDPVPLPRAYARFRQLQIRLLIRTA